MADVFLRPQMDRHRTTHRAELLIRIAEWNDPVVIELVALVDGCQVTIDSTSLGANDLHHLWERAHVRYHFERGDAQAREEAELVRAQWGSEPRRVFAR